jgi:hypothetical protein
MLPLLFDYRDVSFEVIEHTLFIQGDETRICDQQATLQLTL